MRMPAFTISSITGRIPSTASADKGYWGLLGRCLVVVFTITGSAVFIRPTSVGPDDHNVSGSVPSSGKSSKAKVSHSVESSVLSDMCVAGCAVHTQPRAFLMHPVL